MIFLLHVTLSISSPTLSPALFIPRWHPSFHLVFDHPFFLFTGISILNTFLSMCSSSLIIVCSYQFNCLSVMNLRTYETRLFQIDHLQHVLVSLLPVPSLGQASCILTGWKDALMAPLITGQFSTNPHSLGETTV